MKKKDAPAREIPPTLAPGLLLPHQVELLAHLKKREKILLAMELGAPPVVAISCATRTGKNADDWWKLLNAAASNGFFK